MSVTPEQLMQAGLAREDVEVVVDLAPLLEQFEKIEQLPMDQRDYLSLYLNLENYVAHSNLGYTAEDLRLVIKKKFNTKWFPPRIRSLFESSAPVTLILTEVFLEECLHQFLMAVNQPVLRGKVESLTQNTTLYGIKFKSDRADFSNIDFKMYAADIDYSASFADLHQILLSLKQQYTLAVGISQVQAIYQTAFDIVKKKYVHLPSFGVMVKMLPDGIVDEEKLSLLTREELAKVRRKMSKIDVMKSEFTNIAAHELKTPLVPMVGYVDMMLNDPGKYGLNEQGKKLINILSRNTHRLHQLVDEILDISKLESDEMKFDMEEIILAPTIKEVVSDMQPLARKKNLILKCILPPPKKRTKVVADVQRISQVISNLVKNAIKFTDAGSVTIKAEIKGDNLQVSIKDTGVGLDEKEIQKMFTKFYQAEQASTRKTQGTGLGLAICKSLIESHEGKIWVTSPGKGKGSTFIFSLPIKRN